MRWTLALLTGALLSSTAMAQSLQPGLYAALPQLPLTPSIELPVAAVGPAAVEHQTTATAAPDTLPVPSAPPVAAIAAAPIAPHIDTDDQVQAFGRSEAKRDPSIRARTAVSPPRARAYQPRYEPTPPPSYHRTYQVRRDLGRFHPPVF